jgi:hypothetical protein
MHIVDLILQLMCTGVVPDPLFSAFQLVSLPERPTFWFSRLCDSPMTIDPTGLTDVGRYL